MPFRGIDRPAAGKRHTIERSMAVEPGGRRTGDGGIAPGIQCPDSYWFAPHRQRVDPFVSVGTVDDRVTCHAIHEDREFPLPHGQTARSFLVIEQPQDRHVLRIRRPRGLPPNEVGVLGRDDRRPPDDAVAG